MKPLNTEKIFLFLFSIWIIDIITTAIKFMLGDSVLESNMIEHNLIANLFFSMGIAGWLLWIFICGLCLLGFSYILFVTTKLKHGKIIPIIAIVAFYILEIYVIISNLTYIL